jgi:hypothetical protein
MPRITELDPASSGPLVGTELIPVVQGGVTVHVLAQDIANLGGGAVGSVNGQTGVVVLDAVDVGATIDPSFLSGVSNLSGAEILTVEQVGVPVQVTTQQIANLGTAGTAPDWVNIQLISELPHTSGLDGDEHVVVEKGSTFIQTTSLFLSRLLLGFTNIFRRNQSVNPFALTDGANIATDASLSNIFKVTLAGNRTLDNPTNLSDGMVLNWIVKQDGTGGRTLAYGSKFKWPSGSAPVLTTTAGSVHLISALYDVGNDILIATSSLDHR